MCHVFSDELIPPEVINAYLDGKRSQEAKKLLAPNTTTEMPTGRNTHTQVRNYLILQMCVHNGPRSGVITNMTLGNFQQAKKRGLVNGNYVIHVSASSYMYLKQFSRYKSVLLLLVFAILTLFS